MAQASHSRNAITDEFDFATTTQLMLRLKGEIEGLKLWLHVLIATHPNIGAAKALMEQLQGQRGADPASFGPGYSAIQVGGCDVVQAGRSPLSFLRE